MRRKRPPPLWAIYFRTNTAMRAARTKYSDFGNNEKHRHGNMAAGRKSYAAFGECSGEFIHVYSSCTRSAGAAGSKCYVQFYYNGSAISGQLYSSMATLR